MSLRKLNNNAIIIFIVLGILLFAVTLFVQSNAEKASAVDNDDLPSGAYLFDDAGSLVPVSVESSGNTKNIFETDPSVVKKKYEECLATGNSFVVAIDAGHGGTDPGACGGGLQEKNVNLRIAQACKNELMQYSGVSVYMVREWDEYVGLQERVERARAAGANLFVCLHNNSGGGHGSEVWVQHPGGYQPGFYDIGASIGNSILSKLSAWFGLENRDIKYRYCTDGSTYPDGSVGDYFTVLYWSRYYNIPGFLVEHAFIDTEYWLLANDSFLVDMGIADAQAIADYYGFTKGKPQPYVTKMDIHKTTLSWKSVTGAEKYAVAKYVNGQYINYTTDLKENTIDIADLSIGNSYEFLVQAWINGRWNPFTIHDHLKVNYYPCPECTVVETGDGTVTVAWKSLPNISNYAVAEYVDGRYVTFSKSCKNLTYTFDNLENGIQHLFLIQGEYGSDVWSWFNEKNIIAATPNGHDKPYDIQSTTNVTTIDFSWHKVPGAVCYAVASQNPDGSWHNYTTSCADTKFTVSGLEPGKTYNFLIQAQFRHERWSSFDQSDIISLKTTVDRPKATAVPGGDGEVNLSWSKIKGVSTYGIFEVVNGVLKPLEQKCHEVTYTAKDLSNGIDHYFVVRALINDKEWSVYESKDIVSCIPSGHTKIYDIKITSRTLDSISLSWAHLSGATKYAVAIFNDDLSYITYTDSCTVEHYTIKGLKNSTDYKILIQGWLTDSWSKWDPNDFFIASTVDFRPKPRVASIDDGVVNISWDAVQGAEQYAIAEWNGVSYLNFSIDWKYTEYSCTNLLNGKSHKFLVQAYHNGEWSPVSEISHCIGVPEGPVKPYDISYVRGATSIEFTWHAVSGVDTYAIGYRNDDGSYTNFTTDCHRTNFVATGLDVGKTYYVLIQSLNGSQWSQFDEKKDLVKVTTIDTRPDVRVDSVGDGFVYLSWGKIENSEIYAIAEVVNGQYYNITTSFSSKDEIVKFKCDNLINKKEHVFLVQSWVGGSWSPFTEKNFVKGTPNGPIKPVVVDSDCAAKSIKLIWKPVSGVDHYAIGLRNSDGSYTTYTRDCKKTEYIITNLAVNTKYEFLVQSWLGDGWSPYDESVDLYSASTLEIRPKVEVVSTGDGTATLKWKNIDGAEKFAIAEVVNGEFRNFTDKLESYEDYVVYTCTNLSNGYPHVILVQAFVAGSWTMFDAENFITVTPKGPTVKPAVSRHVSEIDSVTLYWNFVPGTERYAVGSLNDDGITYTTYTRDCQDLSFKVTDLIGNKEYKFLVQSYINGNWTAFTEADYYSATPLADPLRPVITSYSVNPGEVTLNWTAIPGVNKYAVGTQNYDCSWTTYTTNCTDTSFTIRGLDGGEYRFLVQSWLESSQNWSDWDGGNITTISVPVTEKILILHQNRTSWQQLSRFYISSTHDYPSFYADKDYPTLNSFCKACCDISALEGVDPSVMFCLIMKETGWLHYGGQVFIEQFNFGGIKNYNGVGFHSFGSMYEGLLALVQHLKAYATDAPLNTLKVDPRYDLVNKGVAPYVEDLGGPGRWTPDSKYGYDIRNMILNLWNS